MGRLKHILAVALPLAAACGGGESVEPTTTSSNGGAAGTGGEGGAMVDPGDTCADALELVAQTNAAGGLYHEHWGVLDPAGDRDTFRFDAVAGQWFGLVIQANPASDPSRIDTVLTLFDDSGTTQLAQADGSPPYLMTDSQITHRFAQDGSYCVEVAERSDRLGEPPLGGPEHEYRLLVYPVEAGMYDDWDLEQEPNDEPAQAQTVRTVPYALPSTRIVGGHESDDDVDWYRLVTSSTTEYLRVGFTPTGPEGFGATTGPGIVRLRHDEPDGAIVAELDYQSRPPASFPNTYGGIETQAEPDHAYLIEVRRPASQPVGANDFYVLWATESWLGSTENEPNNDPSHAEWAPSPVPYQTGASYTIQEGTLPPGDVDWVQFPTELGNSIAVDCGSWSHGSSLRDATFALYPVNAAATGPVEEPILVETETPGGVRWSDEPTFDPTGPAVISEVDGSHYLRISATTYEPGVESVYYYCDIITSGTP